MRIYPRAPCSRCPCLSRALDQVDPEVPPNLSHDSVNLGLFAGSWEQGAQEKDVMVVESGLPWVCLFVEARMMAQQLRLKHGWEGRTTNLDASKYLGTPSV